MLFTVSKIRPLVWIRLMIVEFFGAIGITNVSPMLRSNSDVALVERCVGRPFPSGPQDLSEAVVAIYLRGLLAGAVLSGRKASGKGQSRPPACLFASPP